MTHTCHVTQIQQTEKYCTLFLWFYWQNPFCCVKATALCYHFQLRSALKTLLAVATMTPFLHEISDCLNFVWIAYNLSWLWTYIVFWGNLIFYILVFGFSSSVEHFHRIWMCNISMPVPGWSLDVYWSLLQAFISFSLIGHVVECKGWSCGTDVITTIE